LHDGVLDACAARRNGAVVHEGRLRLVARPPRR
jgi:hypothetical protein